MKLKPVYINLIFALALLVIFLIDSFSYLVTHYGGINIIPQWAVFLRNIFLISTFSGFFYYSYTNTVLSKPESVNSAWKAIISIGVFILLHILIKYVGWESDFDKSGKDTAETGTILIPQTFFTILKVHLFGISYFFFGMFIWLKLRDFIYFKRNKNTSIYFLGALFAVATASLIQYFISEENTIISFISISLGTIAVILILINSFKWSWVLYVPRKEKITGIFLIIFMLILLILLKANDIINEDALLFYSPAISTFALFSLLLLGVFGTFSFFSLLFHLPTSEVFERKSSELSSIHSLSRLISDVFDLNELSEAVIGYSIQSSHSEFGWVELLVEGKDHIKTPKIYATKNISYDDLERLTVNTEKSLKEKIYSAPTIILIDKADQSDMLDQSIVKSNKIGSLVVVPLISRGELVGGLFVGKSLSFGFDKDDLDTITTFADQAAIAIDNSRLIEKSLEKERLQQELFIAQSMQMKLLPQKTPVLEFLDVESVSYPAYEVGGDYYDFVHLPDGNFGIIVADVSGKGTSAAFYMAEVKGIFQSLARSIFSPKSLLVEANQVLYGTMDRKSFVSLLYSVFDLKTGRLIFARAGHCPLLLVRQNGEYLFIKSKGIGIGITKSVILEEQLEEVTINLQEGDICLMFSDGVVEAMDAEMEEYGYDRLGKLIVENVHLSASGILQKVISEINNFTYDGKANDDLTLVVTKWNKNK